MIEKDFREFILLLITFLLKMKETKRERKRNIAFTCIIRQIKTTWNSQYFPIFLAQLENVTELLQSIKHLILKARQRKGVRNLWKNSSNTQAEFRDLSPKKQQRVTRYGRWLACETAANIARTKYSLRENYALVARYNVSKGVGGINFQRNLIRRGIKKKKKKGKMEKRKKRRTKNQTTQQKQRGEGTGEKKNTLQLVHLAAVKAIKSSLATAQGVMTRFEVAKLFRKSINAVAHATNSRDNVETAVELWRYWFFAGNWVAWSRYIVTPPIN